MEWERWWGDHETKMIERVEQRSYKMCWSFSILPSIQKAVGVIVDALKEKGLYNETLIVVSLNYNCPRTLKRTVSKEQKQKITIEKKYNKQTNTALLLFRYLPTTAVLSTRTERVSA